MTNNLWWAVPAAKTNEAVRQAAEQRQSILTKPPGALGRLEATAIQLAALQADEQPHIDNIHITVFAADHGVAVEGISAFPQQVTYEMVKNFSHGGAAINVIAREIGATLEVINLGTVVEAEAMNGVMNEILGPGTANFCVEAAMSEDQLAKAMQLGKAATERAKANKANLCIGGDMGIGNTTTAAALACALLDTDARRLAGPGTGIDATGISHKVDVINRAIQFHREQLDEPLEVLRRLGGFEIAALTGYYISCAQNGVTVLVDGFISSAAALVAIRLNPSVSDWFLYSHTSAEPGHQIILNALNARPLLDLGMRLGEGSGAATAVPLLRLACALHNGMATFEDAGVSSKS